MFVFVGTANEAGVSPEAPSRMPTRRNLCVSLPPPSPRSVSQAQGSEEEGLVPLQHTPEPLSSVTMDPNVTFEVLDNDDETAACAPFTGGSGAPCTAPKSLDASVPSQSVPRSKDGNQIPDYKR